MARKSKGRKTPKQQQSQLTISDFIFPGEKSSYLGGVAAVGIIFIWLAVAGFLMVKNAAGQRLWYVPLEILAWPVLTVIVCNMLAVRPRLQQIKKVGRQAKVMSNNHPDLHRLLTHQASLLGFSKQPEMYLVRDEQPIIYSIPGGQGAVIISDSLRERMSPGEFEALVAHELTHIRCKHVRLELAIVFVRGGNPVIKLLFFPVLLMMLFARAWIELIDFTADRGALLVTLKPKTVNSALVKLSVISDPNAGITQAELEEFLSSAGEIQSDAQQLERHFKVGQFLSSQPQLKERIEQLKDFAESDQGKQAIAKMAQLQGVALNSIPMTKGSAGPDVAQVIDDSEDSSPEL